MWSGEILVNQRPRSPFFNRDSAYVLQDDVHISTLTVEETIYYAAWTRMPEGTTQNQMKARVTQLLEMMGLDHVKDSIVGDAMTKGISGGQLKLLSIAVEIVSLPNLIFLDEPTSGLDSSISLEVMSAVRGLANQGRTCISTIHQPSPEVFALFDRAVLVCGGRLIYSGPADEAVSFYTRPELGYKYDKDQNPAEFIIEVCGGTAYPEGWITPRQPEELQELYNKSSYVQKPAEQLDFDAEPSAYTRKHATSKLTQFKMLMHRGWYSRIRDRKDMKTQLFKVVFSGLAIGAVFYGKADISYPFLEEDLRTKELVALPNVNSCVSLVFISTM
jgi:ABC-type multidrug transport system ATPase subunit